MQSRDFVASGVGWILGILLACSQTPTVEPATRIESVPPIQVAFPSPPDAAIELERTFCFGSCPVFTVRLEGDGTVRWEGRSYVGATGVRTTHVPPFEARYLFDRFRALDFLRLEPRYGVRDDDGPMEILRLRVGEECKTVENDSIGGRLDSGGREIEGWQTPDELIALREAIESILGLERWIRVDEPIEARSSDFANEAFGLSADALGSMQVELESGGDEDWSSGYRILLRGDGEVRWNGRDHVRELGERTAAIPVEHVRWLLHRFERVGFFDLHDVDLGPARTCCPSSLRLRLPGREHAVDFRTPAWPPIRGQHPDATYRTAIDCVALANTIRVLVRADRWIGRGGDLIERPKPR